VTSTTMQVVTCIKLSSLYRKLSDKHMTGSRHVLAHTFVTTLYVIYAFMPSPTFFVSVIVIWILYLLCSDVSFGCQ